MHTRNSPLILLSALDSPVHGRVDMWTISLEGKRAMRRIQGMFWSDIEVTMTFFPSTWPLSPLHNWDTMTSRSQDLTDHQSSKKWTCPDRSGMNAVFLCFVQPREACLLTWCWPNKLAPLGLPLVQCCLFNSWFVRVGGDRWVKVQDLQSLTRVVSKSWSKPPVHHLRFRALHLS